MNDINNQEYEEIIETPDEFVIGITKNGKKVLIKYKGIQTEVIIPKGIQVIGDSAFFNNTNITSVTIPQSVEIIEHNAFAHCKKLTNIIIPEGVETIGYGAFCNCVSLENITIPGSVELIGLYAFGNCSNLASIVLLEDEQNKVVKEIGDSAFYNCNNLTDIVIPGSVESIGESAFGKCTNLNSITMLEGVKKIGISAFYNCTKLSNIDIPKSVKKIENFAFINCNNLTDIIIPGSVESIGELAFACQNLSKIRCFNINFSASSAQLSKLYNKFPDGIISNNDNLPIYFEGNNNATQILKQIFKTTAQDKIKGNILDRYNEFSFLKNIEFLQKIIPSSITINGEEILIDDNQRNNIIASIFTKNPQLFQANIEETALNNYQYLVEQKILSEEELHSYYFGCSQKKLINEEVVTTEEVENKDGKYIIKALRQYFKENYNPTLPPNHEIPRLFSTLVVESNEKNQREFYNRLSLAYLSPKNKREQVLKGSSFKTICINDQNNFLEVTGDSAETFFTDYDMFKGIKTSLYRKLNGMNSDLVRDLNTLAEENQQNTFSNFLNSLETVKNWNLFDSEIERAIYFRNEFIGKILYAYLTIIKQKKDELGLELDFSTKPKSEVDYKRLIQKINPENLYTISKIRIEEIIEEATKSQQKLFNDEILIDIMLKINPYSYDALRNYRTKYQNCYIAYADMDDEYQNRFISFADLAKKHGYFFSQEEKMSMLKCQKEILIPKLTRGTVADKKNKAEAKKSRDEESKRYVRRLERSFVDYITSSEPIDNFIEYVNNRLGITALSTKEREKYFTIFSKFVDLYINENKEDLMNLLRICDFYCRANNEEELQSIQGYNFSSEQLFDINEDYTNEDRIMYLLFLMNKLAHNNKDINLMASIKDDYRFDGYNKRKNILMKAMNGFSFLERYGLTPVSLKETLSLDNHSNMNNIFRAYFENLSSSTADRAIELWCNFCSGLYIAQKSAQDNGVAPNKLFQTEEEIKNLTNRIRLISMLSSPNNKEKLKKLLDPNTSFEEKEEYKKTMFKLVPKEFLETFEKVEKVIEAMSPISQLTKKEVDEIELISREYKLFFEVKSILGNKLIEKYKDEIISETKKTISEVFSLDKTSKKKYYERYGYIIEIQKDESIDPILVCLNKKFNKPFSIHIKDLPPELGNLIQRMLASKNGNLSNTIAHAKVEQSSQYPTVSKRNLEKPQTNNNRAENNLITSGFNVYKGSANWRDYLISLYNYANYDYDEERNIKNRIDQSSEENKDEELNNLFYLISDRNKLLDVSNTSEKNTICRLFCENLQVNNSSETFDGLFEEIVIDFQTKHSIPNDIKNSFQRTNFILGKLCKKHNETATKIESLIELYATYKPDMVEIVKVKKGNQEEIKIKIKNDIPEGKDIEINEWFVSPNFKTKIENIKSNSSNSSPSRTFEELFEELTRDYQSKSLIPNNENSTFQQLSDILNVLCKKHNETATKIEHLVELYATYKPDMVEIVNQEEKKIKIKSSIYKDIEINEWYASPNFETKIENIKTRNLTTSDINKFFNDKNFNSDEFLFGTSDENKKRLKSLIELYATYKPDMVEIVNQEKDGKQIQQIKISGNKKERTLELFIDVNHFSDGITIKGERIKPNIQQEVSAQNESKKNLMSSFVPRFKNIIKAISESIHGIVINRGQVQGNANSNTQNKPPSM